MLESGKTIDRYVVESLIGSGGTAVVYRVRHASLGTLHALKVLSVTSDVIRDRMLQEGRVQAALRHPNVVAVTDVIAVESAPGLLMEYIEGPSLDRALREYRLPIEAAEVLFLGIVAGVRQAHIHGLVHRDLKPANVLLARTPDGFVPKVTDFGLAKVLAEVSAGGGHTRSGIAMGTPAYMSPEQIRDARTVDQRADIFSLGCILYELVCHQRTFPGDDAITIYNSVISGEFTAPKRLVPDLPDRIDQAIRGSLAMDREQRIPDADTLLAVMRGERAWDPAEGTRDAETAEITDTKEHLTRLPANAPVMQVAVTNVGITPEEPPSRLHAPVGGGARSSATTSGGMGLSSEIEDMPTDMRELPERGDADGLYPTLGGADDSIVPRDSARDEPAETEELPEPSSGMGWLVTLGLMGMIGLAFFALIAMVVGTLLFGPKTPSAPPPRIEAPVEAPLGAVPPVAPPAGTEAGAPSAGASGTGPAAAVAPSTTAKAPVETKAPTPVGDTKAADPRTKASVPPPDLLRDTPTPGETTPAPAKTSTVRAAAAPVTVKILTKPPTASLLVDGADKGRTPSKLELTPGSHAIEVKSGEDVGRFSVDVKPDVENKWCFSFADRKSYPGACP